MQTILDFFIAEAVKKGAPADFGERIGSADRYSDFGTRNAGLNYKFVYPIGDGKESFTIYGDGGFAYDGETQTIEGKLTPPHSKTWIRRMVKSGMEVDYAKMVWAEFYAVRHGA